LTLRAGAGNKQLLARVPGFGRYVLKLYIYGTESGSGSLSNAIGGATDFSYQSSSNCTLVTAQYGGNLRNNSVFKARETGSLTGYYSIFTELAFDMTESHTLQSDVVINFLDVPHTLTNCNCVITIQGFRNGLEYVRDEIIETPMQQMQREICDLKKLLKPLVIEEKSNAEIDQDYHEARRNTPTVNPPVRLRPYGLVV